MFMQKPKKEIWQRAIIFVDMNAFFASIEQLDHPEWRAQPVVVTNGEMGTCIITCSYEARKFGIKTGMRIKEAQKLCPHLIKAISRLERYATISTKIMEALQQITPDIEVASIDEAFLDITKCQHLYSSPIEAAKYTQYIVNKVSALPCSIGLSADKTTAKFAAEQKKPQGFTVIHPEETTTILANVPVTELCGIGAGIAKYLAQYGAVYCKDVAKLPVSLLAKRFGNIGRRLWLMCQGKDPEPVHNTAAPQKSIGHGKILPPQTTDINLIKTYLFHMAEKVATRLRINQMFASKFFIGICSTTWGWLTLKYTTPSDTQNSQDIYKGCIKLINDYPDTGVIRQIQITALNPKFNSRQIDLFEEQTFHRKSLLDTTIDEINQKFREVMIKPAVLLDLETNYQNKAMRINYVRRRFI
jgi:DNA polymerase IV